MIAAAFLFVAVTRPFVGLASWDTPASYAQEFTNNNNSRVHLLRCPILILQLNYTTLNQRYELGQLDARHQNALSVLDSAPCAGIWGMLII